MERFSPRERVLAAGAAVVYTFGGYHAAVNEFGPADLLRSAKWSASTLGFSLCPEAPTAEELDAVKRDVSTALADPQPFTASHEVRQLERSLSDASDAQAATSIVNRFTERHLGFSTSLLLTKNQINTKLDVENYKQGLLAFANYADALPPNLLTSIELDEVRITNLSEQTQTANGYALGSYAFEKAELVIAPNTLSSPDILAHEVLGHAVHLAECNGMVGNDTTFSDLNPRGTHDYIALGDNLCVPPLKRPEQFASAYSQVQVYEDVAETTSRFTTNQSLTNSELLPDSALGNKTLLILQRADELAPGSAVELAHARAHLGELVTQYASIGEIYAKDPLPPRTAADEITCPTH